MLLNFLFTILLIMVAETFPRSASLPFPNKDTIGDGISNRMIPLQSRSNMGPLLSRQNLQLPILPFPSSYFPHEAQRYHFPLFRKNSKFSPPVDDLEREDSPIHFSGRRMNFPETEKMDEATLLDGPLGFGEQISSLEPSFTMSRMKYFSRNRTDSHPDGKPMIMRSGDGVEFYIPEELKKNLFYDTLRRMHENDRESFPQGWDAFDKDAFKLYVQSALDAFKTKGDRSDLRRLPPNSNLRVKRSAAEESSDEEEGSDSRSQHVDHNSHTSAAGAQPIWTNSREMNRLKRDYDGLDLTQSKRDFSQDDLTQEYFKQLAQSIDTKKKRSGGAFQVNKRMGNLEDMLEDPTVLHYAQEKLEETEQDIIEEAENELRGELHGEKLGEDQAKSLLANSITRLNALQNMQESLHQLELLQQKNLFKKRAMDLSIDDDPRMTMEKEKRRKVLAQLREDLSNKLKRNFTPNKSEDGCPILSKLISDCGRVLQMVGDEQKTFLDACLIHEVCYMSGSIGGISRHECDATLSSSLEVSCMASDPGTYQGTGSAECRQSAGVTYEALSDPNRYDDEGAIPPDPCLKELLYDQR